MATEKTPFASATIKFTIGSLDKPSLTVSAQYNPKEISVSQAVTWNADAKKGAGDQALMYQSGARNSQKYTVDLIFDGVEGGGSMGKGQPTVATAIAQLRELVEIQPVRPDFQDPRPHFCVALWGKDGIPPMSCVIDNLTVKYEMFDDMGQVIRATATVSIMEAWRVDKNKNAPAVKDARYLALHPPIASSSKTAPSAPPRPPATSTAAPKETSAQAQARRTAYVQKVGAE